MGIVDCFANRIIERTVRDHDYGLKIAQALSVLKTNPYIQAAQSDVRHPFIDVVHQGAFFQTPDRTAAAIMWQLVLMGDLRYRIIEIADEPQADKMIAENDAALKGLVEVSQETDGLFTEAEFWGGTQDYDGMICTSSPLMNWAKAFPLEVGSQRGAKTLMQLRLYRCLARWPYESPYIYFLEMPFRGAREDRF